ncbi:MAG: flagellar protein FlaG [Lachnospiraceae bacterium]|nr:flagellar protein FlaG [Lachnospiraceae bacterium]MEE3460585.1 flagellar protein FlaG [Lachnospiraceae bacterium]
MQVSPISGAGASQSVDPAYDQAAAEQAVQIRLPGSGSGKVSGDVKVSTGNDNDDQKDPVIDLDGKKKDPADSSIDSAVSNLNYKIKPSRTRCEYSYDKPTRMVSIKVFDDVSGKLIREVPPEESLKMLQKMWEIAGILVDEKR